MYGCCELRIIHYIKREFKQFIFNVNTRYIKILQEKNK